MVVSTAYYSLGPEHTAQEWATIVATLAQGQRTGERVCEQTYLDTFDWAVCRAGITLIAEQTDTCALRILVDDVALAYPESLQVDDIPIWPTDLPQGKMRNHLMKLADLRSFLPLAHVKSEQIILHVEDKKGRQRVRLVIECNFQHTAPRRKMTELGCRLRVECLAGYEKDFAKTLPRFDGLTRTSQSAFFEEVMKNAGRVPKDYSGKLKIKLERDMRSDAACKMILLDQLDQIVCNIDGTLADTDTEFLHDLRVAVRRSRSALNRLKGVLPQTVQDRFSQELQWVGSITTPVRDLDVYLLDYPKYREQLRDDLQTDLEPLYDFLLAHHKKARAQLVTDLGSRRFKDFLTKWRSYLKRPLPVRPTAPAAHFSIGELADKRIWKTYRRVINEGSVIDESSPAEALHDLRKTCKKLRYVLEFFASLYPQKEVGGLIKTLKVLQENLGDFQDLDVQAETLNGYSNEMLAEGVKNPKVFMAMGVLVEQFMVRKGEVRMEFAKRFEAFASKEVENKFRKLVGRQKVKTLSVANVAKG